MNGGLIESWGREIGAAGHCLKPAGAANFIAAKNVPELPSSSYFRVRPARRVGT